MVAALGLVATPAAAQTGSRTVVQGAPDGQTAVLSAALARLGRDPRDLGALIDAGIAALSLGDVDAAVGFFRRADQVSPGNARVKAGLASALVRSENPFDAIPMFADAERAGPIDPSLLSDRGLAYDLVGDNATAQRYYRQVLAIIPDDETSRRLALSLAIAGDRRGSEAALLPLLRRQDKAAWRTRAFALAVLGEPEQGVAIANTTMPADLAAAVAPYLRYMPRLTRAQQAAAANLGQFPRAADIGRDDPRVAAFTGRRGTDTRLSAANDHAQSHRDALARRQAEQAARAREEAERAAAARLAAAAPRIAPPEPQPGRSDFPAPVAAPPPAPAVAPLPPAAPERVAVATPTVPPPALNRPIQGPPADIGAPGPSFVSLQTAPPPSAAAPTPSAPVAAPMPHRSLADAFRDLTLPAADTRAAPAPGAVDITRITRPKIEAVVPVKVADSAAPVAARGKLAGSRTAGRAGEAEKAPPKLAQPSRIWVQVATGRDKDALAFDWRRLARENAQPFRNRKPFISEWGRTNRLLTGPFESETAANAFVAELRKAQLDPFVWTSQAGQVVDPLAG